MIYPFLIFRGLFSLETLFLSLLRKIFILFAPPRRVGEGLTRRKDTFADGS